MLIISFRCTAEAASSSTFCGIIIGNQIGLYNSLTNDISLLEEYREWTQINHLEIYMPLVVSIVYIIGVYNQFVILQAFYPIILTLCHCVSSAYIFILFFNMLSTRGQIIFIHYLCSTVTVNLAQFNCLPRYCLIIMVDFTDFTQFLVGIIIFNKFACF